jgi:hypothetical protein
MVFLVFTNSNKIVWAKHGLPSDIDGNENKMALKLIRFRIDSKLHG